MEKNLLLQPHKTDISAFSVWSDSGMTAVFVTFILGGITEY